MTVPEACTVAGCVCRAFDGPDHAAYCGSCGHPHQQHSSTAAGATAVAGADQSEAAPRHCRQCGQPVDRDLGPFCVACGAPINPTRDVGSAEILEAFGGAVGSRIDIPAIQSALIAGLVWIVLTLAIALGLTLIMGDSAGPALAGAPSSTADNVSDEIQGFSNGRLPTGAGWRLLENDGNLAQRTLAMWQTLGGAGFAASTDDAESVTTIGIRWAALGGQILGGILLGIIILMLLGRSRAAAIRPGFALPLLFILVLASLISSAVSVGDVQLEEQRFAAVSATAPSLAFGLLITWLIGLGVVCWRTPRAEWPTRIATSRWFLALRRLVAATVLTLVVLMAVFAIGALALRVASPPGNAPQTSTLEALPAAVLRLPDAAVAAIPFSLGAQAAETMTTYFVAEGDSPSEVEVDGRRLGSFLDAAPWWAGWPLAILTWVAIAAPLGMLGFAIARSGAFASRQSLVAAVLALAGGFAVIMALANAMARLRVSALTDRDDGIEVGFRTTIGINVGETLLLCGIVGLICIAAGAAVVELARQRLGSH
jgi:hypothetical protein